MLERSLDWIRGHLGRSPAPRAHPPGFPWAALRAQSNHRIFVEPSAEARRACRSIAEAYRPVLDRYRVPFDQFFAGSVKEEDAAALYALVRSRAPRCAYQVGTFLGYSAMVIAEALRANGAGRLVACDPELPHRTFINPVGVARQVARELGLEDQIRFVRGWNATPIGDDYGDRFKRSIPVAGREFLQELGEIDLAFVDGDHSLSSTLSDLLLLQEFLALHGVMVFHDVKSWPTVAHALHLFMGDTYFYRNGTHAFFTLDTYEGPDGLAAMERIRTAAQPILCVRVRSEDGEPIGRAEVTLRDAGFSSVTGDDGSLYYFGEADEKMRLSISSQGYADFEGILSVSTSGDFVETTIVLSAD